MRMQVVTLKLSESLYRSAHQIAKATRRPLETVLQDSISHALPPLDDVPPEEATRLAAMALLDDATLWREARATLAVNQQAELQELLDLQGAGEISSLRQAQDTAHDKVRLQALLDAYGRLMVRKAHAWLLLARRGYRVPSFESEYQGNEP